MLAHKRGPHLRAHTTGPCSYPSGLGLGNMKKIMKKKQKKRKQLKLNKKKKKTKHKQRKKEKKR